MGGAHRRLWMLAREKATGWTQFTQALLDTDGDREEALDAPVEQGIVVALDPSHRPSKLRLPIIGRDELKVGRRVVSADNVVRRGRVTEIKGAAGGADVSFGDGLPPLEMRSATGCIVFVHCASPGPFNDNALLAIFASPTQLNLNQVIIPPVCMSSAMLAMLESARRAGTMDSDFGQELTSATLPEDMPTVLKAYTPGSGESSYDLLPL